MLATSTETGASSSFDNVLDFYQNTMSLAEGKRLESIRSYESDCRVKSLLFFHSL